jgi:hypothetical protein
MCVTKGRRITYDVLNTALVQVLAISEGSEPGQIVDARPADRFNGTTPEPWQYTQSTTDIEVRACTRYRIDITTLMLIFDQSLSV